MPPERVRIVMHQSAIERLLDGPSLTAYRRRQADKIAKAWQGNIHNITGATDASIHVEDSDDETLIVADQAQDPESAWIYLEYGTSDTPAQHPGRRAINDQ